MNLVMFDIDGTLTATTGVDEECYVQAIKQVLSIDDIDTNLTNYTHVTDEGITSEIIEKHMGRKAGKQELTDVRRSFVRLLREEKLSRPSCFKPIEGAADILNRLSGHPESAISLATGGWRESAFLKIQMLGLDLNKIPLATSSDAMSREAIMLLSEERAGMAANREGFRSVVFVGDGIWDVRSARNLGYGFIGIGTGDQADRLRNEGALHVVPDYSDNGLFFQILETMQSAGSPQ